MQQSEVLALDYLSWWSFNFIWHILFLGIMHMNFVMHLSYPPRAVCTRIYVQI